MVDPITATGSCASVGTSLASYWNCLLNVAFLNDPVIASIWFILMLVVIGFVLRLPMTLMTIFGFGMILGLLALFNTPFLISLVLGGVIIIGIFTLMALFRSGKLATD